MATTSEETSFHTSFESWLAEQTESLNELIESTKHQPSEGETTELVQKVTRQYEDYYVTKSRMAGEDVLAVLCPAWRSQLEEAFVWIGGWRPSMAFHLLYSKSGLQLEARLSDVVRRVKTEDLGDLSPGQMVRVDELQRRVIREEREVTEKMAKCQEGVTDTPLVELSHLASRTAGGGDLEERVEENLEDKQEEMKEVLNLADQLRMRTLREIIGILKPMQAVHFLIAAAELHLRLHDWGQKREAVRTSSSSAAAEEPEATH